jgi:glucokinase
MILAGDIGGTNARLALFSRQGAQLAPVIEETFASRDYPDLSTIVKTFLASQPTPPRVACFGVAGPVRQGRTQATNLPWLVEASQLAQALRIDTVLLLNDLESYAYGIPLLTPDDLVVLNRGSADASGNAAVIAAGTGLGQAGLYWDGRQHHPFACEGGHASFAPNDPLQIELLGYLRREFPHVSWERVVSGPGLLNIYRFLRDTGRGEEPVWLAFEMQRRDPAPVISQAALAGTSALCEQALDLFVSLYGSEAGNMALKLMATGGVYVGGGIAPKIVAKLTEPLFMQSFVAKGRLQPLVQDIPVQVIMNDKTALMGAARYAMLTQDRGEMP